MGIRIRETGLDAEPESSPLGSSIAKGLTFVAGSLVSVSAGAATVVATYFTWIFAMSIVAWLWPEAWAQSFGWLPNAHGDPRNIGFAMASLRVLIVALK